MSVWPVQHAKARFKDLLLSAEARTEVSELRKPRPHGAVLAW
jgi:hypothetical protein